MIPWWGWLIIAVAAACALVWLGSAIGAIMLGRKIWRDF